MTRLKYYDEDWDQTRDILTAWWRRELPPGPVLSVTAPRDQPIECPAAGESPTDPRESWLDMEFQITAFEAAIAEVYHGGLAYPYITPLLGPGSMNLFLGAEAGFAPETVWYEPCFKDPAKVDLEIRSDNEYWRWTVAATRLYMERAAGKFLVGIPDMVEGLDVLAALFGTQELLTFLIDCPAEIHRLLRQLDEIYWEAFDPLYEMVKDEREGNVYAAFQIWGPGRTLKTQCDFAAMLSPDMFAEFVCPYMEKQCQQADFSLYHLDGPDCIRHLPVLLSEVPSLKAVQWVAGAGNQHVQSADPAWWDVIWRPVYASGRAANVLGNSPEMVEAFVREFGWAGTFVGTGCETESEARRLLDEAGGWSRS